MAVFLYSHSAPAQGIKPFISLGDGTEILLTHELVPAGPVPTALDPDGVYPYLSYSETANRPVPKKYRFITIENSYIRVKICPDLGGKVFSIIHKASGKEVLYVPEVIRPTRILPRFYFVAGGIEVSFPVSHSPTQNEKVLFDSRLTDDRVYVTCGERELRFGMQWSVEYSLGKNDGFLTQRVKVHNPGHIAAPWMSWSNAALPSAPDTQFHFPKGRVLRHASAIDTIDWKDDGPRSESGILEMTGYFWKQKNVNAFGAFTPSMGSGLYHIADPLSVPGMKLWSYGNGADKAWATLSTADARPYIEIQGGPIGDQSIKWELKPGETRTHTEFWIPSDRPLDIEKMKLPQPELRSENDIPLFEWARENEVRVWNALISSFTNQTDPPLPPDIISGNWPPSGMTGLGKPFDWVIRATSAYDDADIGETWKYYYGVWLAGSGRPRDAVNILTQCKLDIAKVMLGRLYSLEGDPQRAAASLRDVKAPWLQLHPQVVVARDQILRALGKQTMEERVQWLARVAALKDEWVIERRVQLLIDQGKFEEARALLLSTPFQNVHQTYTRTKLWKQICRELSVPCVPIPTSLGEDRLAVFGAYREYE